MSAVPLILKAIEPKINKIIPLVQKSYAIHGKITPELQTSLNDLRTDLITIIKKETRNPYELIEKLKTAESYFYINPKDWRIN